MVCLHCCRLLRQLQRQFSLSDTVREVQTLHPNLYPPPLSLSFSPSLFFSTPLRTLLSLPLPLPSLLLLVFNVHSLTPLLSPVTRTQFDYLLSALGAAPSDAAASLTTSVMTGAAPGDEESCVLRVQELLPHLSKHFILVGRKTEFCHIVAVLLL